MLVSSQRFVRPLLIRLGNVDLKLFPKELLRFWYKHAVHSASYSMENQCVPHHGKLEALEIRVDDVEAVLVEEIATKAFPIQRAVRPLNPLHMVQI
jgi:hypothetical protein